MRKLLLQIINLPAKCLVVLIRAYQATLSPDHGLFKAKYPYGFCRLYPSCSEYGRQSVERFGVMKGGFLAAKRILKCNPFTVPSIDPVQKNI
ncbi:MAG: membrane protein insertion efficiency factor YidD [Candidatus Shapirobacteria bacterium]|nr:membrane protein insertion efficiency factor YidD [Candidatus Shapirobacteria bacterium]